MAEAEDGAELTSVLVFSHSTVGEKCTGHVPGEGKEGQSLLVMIIVYLPRAYAKPWSALLSWPHPTVLGN